MAGNHCNYYSFGVLLMAVTFCLGDDKAVAVYAYCNLHGLWKTEI